MIDNNSFQNKQTEIFKIVEKVSEYNNKIQNHSGNLILLIGKTGSGKTTIFNLLRGGKYKYNQNKDQIELINQSNQNFGSIGQGINSITQEPNLYYNDDYKHLLIDFPGFDNTSGENLFIETVINKIIINNKVKIIYIIENPDMVEQNDPKKEIVKSITLVLNQYLRNQRNILNQNINQDFRQLKWEFNSMHIIDKQNNEQIDNFNNSYQDLWDIFINTPNQKLNQTLQLKNPQLINDYLYEAQQNLFNSFLNFIQSKLTFFLWKSKLSTIKKYIQELQKEIFTKDINNLNQQTFDCYKSRMENILKDLELPYCAKVLFNIGQKFSQRNLDQFYEFDINMTQEIERFGKIFLFFREFSNKFVEYERFKDKFLEWNTQCNDIISKCDTLIKLNNTSIIVSGIISIGLSGILIWGFHGLILKIGLTSFKYLVSFSKTTIQLIQQHYFIGLCGGLLTITMASKFIYTEYIQQRQERLLQI